MDHQDWTVVTIKRTPKKDHSGVHVNHSIVPKSDALDISYIPRKCVTSESLQALIRKRIEMKLNQESADKLCAFPVNTFKNIESKRIIPTEKHQMVIQKQLCVQLKIETR